MPQGFRADPNASTTTHLAFEAKLSQAADTLCASTDIPVLKT
jgi:hypothetical protein